ncbi:unnamed protein product [Bubo scandiacus]
MVCVELAMHLNPLSGEGSKGADQASVVLNIPSLLVGRKEGLILEWRVSESLRVGVSCPGCVCPTSCAPPAYSLVGWCEEQKRP